MILHQEPQCVGTPPPARWEAPADLLSQHATSEQIAVYAADRKARSSQRIPAEHAIALIKWWGQLQRYAGRRDAFPDIIRAVAGLVADRAAVW